MKTILIILIAVALLLFIFGYNSWLEKHYEVSVLSFGRILLGCADAFILLQLGNAESAMDVLGIIATSGIITLILLVVNYSKVKSFLQALLMTLWHMTSGLAIIVFLNELFYDKKKKKEVTVMQYQSPNYSPRGSWWLLDIETNGVTFGRDDIIALRLAFMENFTVTQEQTILVRPGHELSPGIERITGITNNDLINAAPLSTAVQKLKCLAREAPLVFWDGNFTLPFLNSAFEKCRGRFMLPHLSIDSLAKILLGEFCDKTLKRTLNRMNIPCDSSLQNRCIAELHTLTKLLFERLEQQEIHTASELE